MQTLGRWLQDDKIAKNMHLWRESISEGEIEVPSYVRKYKFCSKDKCCQIGGLSRKLFRRIGFICCFFFYLAYLQTCDGRWYCSDKCFHHDAQKNITYCKLPEKVNQSKNEKLYRFKLHWNHQNGPCKEPN